MAQRQAVGNPAYDALVHGEVAGSATASQLPDVAASMFEIQASADNAGNVYLGASSAVTKAAGTTTTTAGIQLTPGQSRIFFVINLNLLWRICDNAGDDVTYIGYH